LTHCTPSHNQPVPIARKARMNRVHRLREAPCWSILRKSWVGHLMDGCRDVPPGSLVRMFTLFAQHEMQLARRNDGVECRTFRGFVRGQCPGTPHSFLWQASPETPQQDRGWRMEDGGSKIAWRSSILYPPSSILHLCGSTDGAQGKSNLAEVMS
jgi:hypothetical protein